MQIIKKERLKGFSMFGYAEGEYVHLHVIHALKNDSITFDVWISEETDDYPPSMTYLYDSIMPIPSSGDIESAISAILETKDEFAKILSRYIKYAAC